MATLKWESGENRYICSACGARFYKHEVERAFDHLYGDDETPNPEHFVPIHCMDCGELMNICELSELYE